MSKLMKAGGLFLVAACFAVPALGDEAPATPAPVAASVALPAPAPATAVAVAPKPTTPKLVCEDDSQIGSHLHKRICLTPEQVEARKKAARDMADSIHSTVQCGASGCSGSGSGGPPN